MSEVEWGNAYRWQAAIDRIKEVRERLIREADEAFPPGTRYELRLAPKELSPDDGLVQGMCWYRSMVMDTDDDWQPGDVYRDGYRIERRLTAS